MIPIMQISQQIDQEKQNQIEKKSIFHLYRENMNEWDTIDIERMIPLTEIETLVMFPHLIKSKKPLNDVEVEIFNSNFKEIYNEVENYITQTTQSLFKTFKFPIKEGLIYDVYIYTPFIKYMPEENLYNVTFFYSFVLGTGDVYFNIIEFFNDELTDLSKDIVIEEMRKLILDVRGSSYCTSDETYHYNEINYQDLNDTLNKSSMTICFNYILQNFIKVNYGIEISVEECIPTVSMPTCDESYKNNDIKHIILTNCNMVIFGPSYYEIRNVKLVAYLVATNFLFRVLFLEYFKESSSELDRFSNDFNEINLTYLNSFIKNNVIIGLTKIHENIIIKDYRARRNQRMKNFTLELSEHLGSLLKGFSKPDGL